MRQSHATLLGTLVAPMVPAIVFAATTPGFTANRWATAVALVPIFYLFALGFTVLTALPTFLVLKRFGLVRWWSASLAGALLGPLVMTLIQGSATLSIDALAAGSAMGAGEALMFWLVWRLCRTTLASERRV